MKHTAVLFFMLERVLCVPGIIYEYEVSYSKYDTQYCVDLHLHTPYMNAIRISKYRSGDCCVSSTIIPLDELCCVVCLQLQRGVRFVCFSNHGSDGSCVEYYVLAFDRTARGFGADESTTLRLWWGQNIFITCRWLDCCLWSSTDKRPDL